MKNVLKVILPVLAFTLASAGAVATKEAKATKSNSAAITAFVQNPSSANCLEVTVNCSEIFSNQACMTGTPSKRAWLKDEQSHECDVTLYRIL